MSAYDPKRTLEHSCEFADKQVQLTQNIVRMAFRLRGQPFSKLRKLSLVMNGPALSSGATSLSLGSSVSASFVVLLNLR